MRRRLARGFGPYTVLSREPEPFRALARIMWAAPEGSREARIAQRTADKAAANPFALRELLAAFCTEVFTYARLDDNLRLRPQLLPPHITAFLLEPADGAVHQPGVRIVAHLDAPELPLPGPINGSHRDLATWLVHAANAEWRSSAADDHSFGPLSHLLAHTDQPHLLAALRSAFVYAVADEAHRATHRDTPGMARPYRLWREREASPTLFTRVLMANPHLPLLPPPSEGENPPEFSDAHAVLLALLTGQFHRVGAIVHANPKGAVYSLSQGLLLPGPPELAAACRQVLRQLDDPVARDEVCSRALYDAEGDMRLAAAAAGYLPSILDEQGKAAFLFATEQWERYDAADPSGRLVRRYFAHSSPRLQRTGEDWWWWALKHAAMSAVSRSGRPDPLPPPRRGTSPSPRSGGPIGGWPTSYGAGGFSTH